MSTLEKGKKLIKYMRSKDYRVLAINIVYLEDVNADTWEPLQGKLDFWDDARILVRDNGEVLLSCEATTEPGRYYTKNTRISEGVFRIAFGQYKDAWQVGDHKGQLALVQCGIIKGYRDGNKNGIRDKNDYIDAGSDFGINQHTTSEFDGSSPDSIGRWSAGCLVGRYSSTHYDKFMPVVQNMGRRTLDTTIIAGDEFADFCKNN
ncbi:hypothetical protein [uncultured Nostoc sp.]|uniref:hypothetical protein n=1 Tax=uncultured Nostoc sp. TaxID=340711 RepID=UPI0035C95948